MPFPPYIYNHYNIQDLYEQYIKYCSKYPHFKSTFKTFHSFYTFHKKNISNSIIYRHVIQLEGRKYHYLYN